jgi:DNA-binding response OmpR family regulator
MESSAAVADTSTLPPIVLLVEDDHDMLDMYSTYFEADGVWMATAETPDEGLGAIEELRPDIDITDVGFDGEPRGVTFVQTIKERADTCDIPLIVLTGLPTTDLPAEMRHVADLFLRKPVPADTLLLNVRRLLESSHTLRARGDRARARVPPLVKKSSELVNRSRAIGNQVEAAVSRCPACRQPLEWVERGSIEGREYDYYHWCLRGCGLYCFDRTAATWIKLA